MHHPIQMIEIVKELLPIRRCLMGNEVSKSLDYVESLVPGFQRLAFPSGYKAFDWEVPDQWKLVRGTLRHESGEIICDSDRNFLEIVLYSPPINITLPKSQLVDRLHFSKERYNAIPYVTSYYKREWGFCMSNEKYNTLPDGNYHVDIDADFQPGLLEISHSVFKGISTHEILFSSYICHPMLANNELSGPALLVKLAEYVHAIQDRKFTYRFILAPETIGALCYLSRYLEELKKNVIAGYILSCVGDNRAHSHICSPAGNNLSDNALRAALRGLDNTKEYSYLDRGSDERQYCSPNVDLPVCGYSRSKYGEYPEYHTSDDDLTVVTEEGLSGSFNVMKSIIDSLELGHKPRLRTIGEPQLGKRGLYCSTGNTGRRDRLTKDIENIIAYSNGSNTIFDICRLTEMSLNDANNALHKLRASDLI
jgi:aminopeptidase-like protein